MAGITLAALAIPEVMALYQDRRDSGDYRFIYLTYSHGFVSVFGSSRHLVVAADSATAAILAAGLVGIAATWVSMSICGRSRECWR